MQRRWLYHAISAATREAVIDLSPMGGVVPGASVYLVGAAAIHAQEHCAALAHFQRLAPEASTEKSQNACGRALSSIVPPLGVPESWST